METYTLLVYEMVPEDTNLYLIPNQVADQYRHFLQQAAGKFVNSDDTNDGMHFLIAATSPKKEYVDNDWTEYGMIFHPYLLSDQSAIEDKIITAIYLSGFIL
jgi:hypothetical protein